MTKRAKTPHKASHRLTPDQEGYLITGIDLGQFDNEVLAKEAWRIHRVALLPEFIRERPGRRPFAWWEWERPHGQLRRQIWGSLPLEDSPIHRGFPSSWPNKSLIVEAEVEFLYRNKLLTREEVREFPTLKAAARESQKARLVTCGYTREELDRIFEEWDACEDKR